MQKNKVKVEIVEYNPSFQSQVEELVLPIQLEEFKVPITKEEQPDLMDIQGTFQRGNGNFWVALQDGEVVGTIGIVDIGHGCVALKKMFVRSDMRGKEVGLAASLMARAKKWCLECGINLIYLGTTSQMKAAHRFYEKNGFEEVQVSDLPSYFPLVHVDTKFYQCVL